ncbi:MAG: type 1 glutamine amidotransferase [Thermoanaerobaculales bacterium]|jgi:GMP synthase (glutamine-hydrolysing)|nr:type 1 glutamine amidotransferase [Thermoanaerobaculales bacterium]
MGSLRSGIRLAIIQIRNHRSSMLQEQSCFVERCGVPRQQIKFLNVVQDPGITFAAVEDAHAVIIGGSGAYSVSDTRHPFTEPMKDLLAELVERDRPLFGICWGHQFMIKHTGGRVVGAPDLGELGTYAVALTEEGRTDPLFAGFPDPFPVQLGHKDTAVSLGPGWRELARSQRSRFQAVRLDGKPVYGTQFHADLDEHRLRERLLVYFDDYVEDETDYDRIISGLGPSDAADRLLERFLELYA